jgi:hypothetical protein
MKWFGTFDPNVDPVDQYTDYLKSTTEKPERISIVRKLLYLLKKGEVDPSKYYSIVDTNQTRLITRIALQSNADVVEYILSKPFVHQNVIAALLHNSNTTISQLGLMLELCDDTNRGLRNSNSVNRKIDTYNTANPRDIS